MTVSGDKIRQARVELKRHTNGRQGSQAWLASQIGAHVTSVSDWERGVNQPSPRHLASIASALGVSIESLLDSDEEGEDLAAVLLSHSTAAKLGFAVSQALLEMRV